MHAGQIDAVPGVRGSAPFVEVQGMLVRNLAIETTLVQGVDLERQRALPGLQRALSAAELAAFADDPQGLLLGAALARRLSVVPGDTLYSIAERFGSTVEAIAAANDIADPRLINVGRGSLIDETALATALNAGRLGGAVLDVFRQEPLPANSPLWETPNLTVTAHIAACSRPADIARLFEENYNRFLAGAPLRHRVDFERGY